MPESAVGLQWDVFSRTISASFGWVVSDFSHFQQLDFFGRGIWQCAGFTVKGQPLPRLEIIFANTELAKWASPTMANPLSLGIREYSHRFELATSLPDVSAHQMAGVCGVSLSS